jgi:hypothetical protein
VITFFTNHTFVVSLVNCATSNPALLQGIEKVSFVRHDFDSLLGQFFSPVTNTYHITEVTNGRPIVRTFQRVVTQPDILFSAADLVVERNGTIIVNIYSRDLYAPPHAVQDTPLPGYPGTTLAGPGTIRPPWTFTFEKVGPIFLNAGPNLIDEATGLLVFVWGSFDGTTNAPIVYPSSRSIHDLENQVLIQITTDSLINAAAGQAYSAQLAANGGTPPYSWSLASGSPDLPAGLGLTSSGLISGTPTEPGTFDFVVSLSDATGLVVNRPLSITITP